MSGINSLMDLVARIVEHLSAPEAGLEFREPIRRGSAEGYVAIEEDPDGRADGLMLVVRLGIMPLPEHGREALFEELLALNHGFRGRAAFSITGDGRVALTAGRPLEDLDPGEILDLVLWTSEQADHHDDGLIARHGS